MSVKVIKNYAELKPEYDVLKLYMLKTSNDSLDVFESIYLNSSNNLPKDKTLVVTLTITQDNELLRSFDWITVSE